MTDGTSKAFPGAAAGRLPLVRRPAAVAGAVAAAGGAVGFRFLLLYFVLEFARPQDLFPVLGRFRPSWLALVGLGIALLRSGRVSLASRVSKGFVLLLIAMTVQVPLAVNTHWAFWSTFAMAQTFVAYLGIVTFARDERRLRLVLWTWIGVHVYLALYALAHRGVGVGGFLGDENDLAMTLVTALPIAVFLAAAAASRRLRLLGIASALLMVVGVAATISRGGFLGLVAAILYCLVRSPRKLAGAVVIAALAGVLGVAAPAGYWAEMNTIVTGEQDGREDTGAGRMYEWRVGWRMFRDNPVLGVGPGNFPYRFSEYEGGESWEGRSLAGRAAHSFYMTLLPELGIVGAATVLVMIVTGWRGLVRMRRRIAAARPRRSPGDGFRVLCGLGLQGGLVAFLVTSAFISTLYYPNLWVLLACMVTLAALPAAASPGSDAPARGAPDAAPSARLDPPRGGSGRRAPGDGPGPGTPEEED